MLEKNLICDLDFGRCRPLGAKSKIQFRNQKNVIAYTQEAAKLDQEEAQIRQKASLDLMELVKGSVGKASRSSLVEAGGKDFMEKFFKGALDANQLEANLERVVKAAETTMVGNKNIETFEAEAKEELINLRNTAKIQLLEIQTQRQIALEQLKALQEINRKQQFDKLIEGLRSRDPQTDAMDNIEFNELRRTVLSPSEEKKKKRDKERGTALRNSNSRGLLDLIQMDTMDAKSLLDRDDAKHSRGEVGLSPEERSKVNLRVLRGSTAERLSAEADWTKGAVQSNNSTDIKSSEKLLDRMIKIGDSAGVTSAQDALNNSLRNADDSSNAVNRAQRIIEGAEAETGGGVAGSAQSLSNAISILDKRIQQINDPANKDSIEISKYRDSIDQSLQSQTGASGVFEEPKTIISQRMQEITRLGNIKKTKDPEADLSSEIKEMNALGEALRLLNQGNGKKASQSILASGGEDIFGLAEIMQKINNTTVGDVDKGLNLSVKDKADREAGKVDFSDVFNASSETIQGSNMILNKSLNSLNTEVKTLAGVMNKEANIAALSILAADAAGKKTEADSARNAVIAEQAPKTVSDEERSAFNETQKDKEVLAAFAVTEPAKRGASMYDEDSPSVDPEYVKAKAAADKLFNMLKFGNLDGVSGGGVSPKTSIPAAEETLNTYKSYLLKNGEEHKLQSLKTFENNGFNTMKKASEGGPSAEENQKLLDALDRLNKASEEANRINAELIKAKDADVKKGATNETAANINVILQGLPEAFASLGPEISDMLQRKVKENIMLYDKEPNLFMMG